MFFRICFFFFFFIGVENSKVAPSKPNFDYGTPSLFLRQHDRRYAHIYTGVRKSIKKKKKRKEKKIYIFIYSCL